MKDKASIRNQVKTGFALTAAAVLTLSIAACGGGSSGTSSASSVSPAPTTMTGTVAVGSAVAGANVSVIGANGVTVSATSDSSGNYSVSLSGLTLPFAVLASDPSGVNPTLVSVVSTVSTGTSAPVVANVTTLTSAVAAMLTTSGNPTDVASTNALTSFVTPASVNAAVAKLNTALAPILAANGLDAKSFDPIKTSFKADQTGHDAVIEAVHLVAAPSGGTQLVSAADTTMAIGLNKGTTVAAPLTVPPHKANFLASLMADFSKCLAGNSASCANAIDSNYLENGFASFKSAHPAFGAAGVKLGLPQTLKFYTENGTPKALVMLRYSTSSGGAGTAVTVAQKTAGGTWDIIGNQQLYDVTIHSFLARRQFVDVANQPYGRYESGIGIRIPVGATGTPNPTNLAAASVSGPGIHGTVYLVLRNGTGNDTLALTSSAATQVPRGGATTDSSTNLYRWSWQALPGSGQLTFVPQTGSLGYYAPTPIDVSSVPHFASYTVTFYDSTGTQIGQPVKVVNPTPTLPAYAGNSIPWQTLSSSTLSDFLNPRGARVGAQTSVSLSWSNIDDNRNKAPVVRKAQIQGVPGTGVTPPTEVDGWWVGPVAFSASGQYTATVTAGVNQNGVQQCTPACQFPALQAGGSRVVDLFWNVGQTAYYNIWKYVD